MFRSSPVTARFTSSAIRHGKPLEVALAVSSKHPMLIESLRGRYPSYFVYGPLVFSPATLDSSVGTTALAATQRSAISAAPWRLAGAIGRSFPVKRLVVIAARCSRIASARGTQPVHQGGEGYQRHWGPATCTTWSRCSCDASDKYLTISFDDRASETIVFDRREALEATDEILTDNGIRQQASDNLSAIWSRRRIDHRRKRGFTPASRRPVRHDRRPRGQCPALASGASGPRSSSPCPLFALGGNRTAVRRGDPTRQALTRFVDTLRFPRNFAVHSPRTGKIIEAVGRKVLTGPLVAALPTATDDRGEQMPADDFEQSAALVAAPARDTMADPVIDDETLRGYLTDALPPERLARVEKAMRGLGRAACPARGGAPGTRRPHVAHLGEIWSAAR